MFCSHERKDISDGINIIEEITKSGKQGNVYRKTDVFTSKNISVVYGVARGKGEESRCRRGS